MQTPLPAKNRKSGFQFSLFLKILSLSFRIFSLFIVVSVVFSVLAIRRISQPAITALNIAMSPPIIRRLISIFPCVSVNEGLNQVLPALLHCKMACMALLFSKQVIITVNALKSIWSNMETLKLSVK